MHAGPGSAHIDNNIVKATLVRDLTLVGTNVHMGLLGTLNAEEGGRAYYKGNEFIVSRAVLTFAEKDRIAAQVDVHAESEVGDYRVTMHAWGPIEEPKFELTSEPSLSQTDVLALLTVGVTAGDRGAMSTTSGAGMVADAMMNISGLDKQIKKFVPRNAVLRDFTFGISAQYAEASGMVEPTVQIESRFLTDAFRLRLSQPVISGRGRKAQGEYRFNDHISAQVQWDNESSSSSLGDLGLDLKLRWEFE